ncbi:MAG: O-antigen ligase family protein [Flavobacteriales bacterium]|nr:O-antigen ligase family protein [Flavobacteriales bacterium]
MISSRSIRSLQPFLVIGLAFSLPWLPYVLPALLVLLVIASLFTGSLTRELNGWSFAPWALGLFLWHLAGMLWTEDHDFGWFDLGIKLPLLAVPVIAMIGPPPDHGTMRRGQLAFVLGCTGFVIFLLLRALALIGHDLALLRAGMHTEEVLLLDRLYSSAFSFHVHPTYLAYYLTLALSIVTVLDVEPRWFARIRPFVSMTLLIGILCCGSKMGWVVLALVLSYLLAIASKPMRCTLIGAALLGGLSFGMLFASIPGFRAKITQAIAALGDVAPDASDSSGARVLVWDTALELVAAYPVLGTGTGDIKNELVRRYCANGYSFPCEHKLNAHSQFLQTLAALGPLGLLLLVFMFVLPLVRSLFQKDHLLTILMLVTILNMAVESMLEVQAGVLACCFLAWLFEGRDDVAEEMRTSQP